MTRAVTWSTPGSVNVVALAPGRRQVIGRADTADIKIDDPTISRAHLAITTAPEPGGQHVLEHLSHTNPTLVNGQAVQGTTAIADGALIAIGDVRLTFHDLHARDTYSGPVCNVCGRENSSSDRDCWFCGESLLNAPTTLREMRKVEARVVSSSGGQGDLYAKQWLVLGPGDALNVHREKPADDTVSVHVDDGRATLVDGRPGSNPAPAQVATGMNVSVDDARFGFIAREEP